MCICSKSWCHTELPSGYRWKQCDNCREKDRNTRRAKTARDRQTTGRLVSAKKETQDDTSNEELDSSSTDTEAEPPLKRVRKEVDLKGHELVDSESDHQFNEDSDENLVKENIVSY